jgi:DNA-binding CsgD family transcriptional regulator
MDDGRVQEQGVHGVLLQSSTPVLPAPRPQLHPSDDAEIAARPEAAHEPPSHPSDDGRRSERIRSAAIGLWLLQRRIRQERADARALRTRLAEAHAAAESWRRETEVLAAGLGRAIDAQFQAWRLTDAEREVALLLLKGLSLREIAGLRETSERTVRQQSLAVYRKAGLAGRADLSAFFLEDLLAPPGGPRAG